MPTPPLPSSPAAAADRLSLPSTLRWDRLFRGIAWGGAMVVVTSLVLSYASRVQLVDSVMHQTFLAADTCVYMLFIIFLARAVDGLTRR
jgi:hypothetical protein